MRLCADAVVTAIALPYVRTGELKLWKLKKFKDFKTIIKNATLFEK